MPLPEIHLFGHLQAIKDIAGTGTQNPITTKLFVLFGSVWLENKVFVIRRCAENEDCVWMA